jgi:uncharacterized protein YehS (DUF1456 family)
MRIGSRLTPKLVAGDLLRSTRQHRNYSECGDDSVKQRLETSLVMRQRKTRCLKRT